MDFSSCCASQMIPVLHIYSELHSSGFTDLREGSHPAGGPRLGLVRSGKNCGGFTGACMRILKSGPTLRKDPARDRSS
jgi:hypothetical protein